MIQRAMKWVPIAALILTSACMGLQLGTPDEVARDVIAAVDEGRTEDAAEIVEAVARRSDLRDLVFPQLYSTAQTRYEDNDPRGAAGILRALAAGYDEASSVRIGLAYSLFLIRGETADPVEADVEELASVLDEIDEMTANPPAFVHLARAQNSIDQGDLEAARTAMARFHDQWEGEPVALAPYIDDVSRYLSSH